MPGTLVAMAPSGPRNSAAAAGLGSQVSMWPGPPLSQKRMTQGSLRGAGVAAGVEEVGEGRAAEAEGAGLEKAPARHALAIGGGVAEDLEHGHPLSRWGPRLARSPGRSGEATPGSISARRRQDKWKSEKPPV